MEKSYLRLYVAIITRAILDSSFRTSPNYDQSDFIVCEEAEKWFLSKDFKWICSLIDIQPIFIIEIKNDLQKTKKKFAQNEAWEIGFETLRRNIE